jgi:hypothetical protein
MSNVLILHQVPPRSPRVAGSLNRATIRPIPRHACVCRRRATWRCSPVGSTGNRLKVVGYLQAENRALREQLGNRHLHFTDEQRRRLVPLGASHLRTAVREYVAHYHRQAP